MDFGSKDMMDVKRCCRCKKELFGFELTEDECDRCREGQMLFDFMIGGDDGDHKEKCSG